jgi:hypothetical protein
MTLKEMKDNLLQHMATTVKRAEDAIVASRTLEVKEALNHLQKTTQNIIQEIHKIELETAAFKLEFEKQKKALETQQAASVQEQALLIAKRASDPNPDWSSHLRNQSAWSQKYLLDSTTFVDTVLDFYKSIKEGQSELAGTVPKLIAAINARTTSVGGMGLFKDAPKAEPKAEGKDPSQRQFFGK